MTIKNGRVTLDCGKCHVVSQELLNLKIGNVIGDYDSIMDIIQMKVEQQKTN